MTTAVLSPRPNATSVADRALKAATTFWFAVIVIGQGLFFYYIVRFYYPSTLTGDFKAWRINDGLIKGYVAGDTVGNLAFGAHVVMAGLVTFGGALQLVPQIRARAPAVHRWIGRVFLTTAIGASLAGLWMTWLRGTLGYLPGALATSLDAVLILTFSVLAWRTALARDFARHRRWALRTFMVANAVWFLRVCFVLAAFTTHAAGLPEPGLKSPVFITLNFACYLVPLAVLELYFRAQTRGGPGGRLVLAGGLFTLTALMSVGALGAWVVFFNPVLSKL